MRHTGCATRGVFLIASPDRRRDEALTGEADWLRGRFTDRCCGNLGDLMSTPESLIPASSSTSPWPPTRIDPLVETLHGRAVADPYRWLEDERNPEVEAWMKAQDDFT